MVPYTSLESASSSTLPVAFAAQEGPTACYHLHYLLLLKWYCQGETQSSQAGCPTHVTYFWYKPSAFVWELSCKLQWMTSARGRARGNPHPFQGYTFPFPYWHSRRHAQAASALLRLNSILYAIDHIPNIPFCCSSVPWINICSLRAGLGCFGLLLSFFFLTTLYSSYSYSF